MKSVMAASMYRFRLIYFNNSCTFLSTSRLSRLYYTKHLNTEIFSNENRFGKRERKCYGRRFCDNNEDKKPKVSVVISRGPFRWISNKLKFLLVHSFFDSDFDEQKFLEGAKQAVCTVSALVSERKFGELEGLLTDEAIQTVKMEVNNLNNIESLHVQMEDIFQSNIHDIGFQYDENEKGRKWLHVMTSFICQGNEQKPKPKELGNITFIRIPLPRITKYSFRKECTSGIDDNWIITRIINFNHDET